MFHYEQENQSKLLNDYYKNTKKRYMGFFVNNTKCGTGTSYYPNNKNSIEYIGDWLDDKKQGHGILYNEDGKVIYKGYWKNDHKHGQGVSYNNDGVIIHNGKWENGSYRKICKLPSFFCNLFS